MSRGPRSSLPQHDLDSLHGIPYAVLVASTVPVVVAHLPVTATHRPFYRCPPPRCYLLPPLSGQTKAVSPRSRARKERQCLAQWDLCSAPLRGRYRRAHALPVWTSSTMPMGRAPALALLCRCVLQLHDFYEVTPGLERCSLHSWVIALGQSQNAIFVLTPTRRVLDKSFAACIDLRIGGTHIRSKHRSRAHQGGLPSTRASRQPHAKLRGPKSSTRL
ncbi:hypothetical protein DFH06DRAFT_1153684 [Mycena polygramma]|nr:hypothetical protein DFH06DRAFT_1153684 [Mycena polygramma]